MKTIEKKDSSAAVTQLLLILKGKFGDEFVKTITSSTLIDDQDNNIQ
ncbi:MAG: hypothetical protein ACFFDN_46940 [Candidatus Hodarchaeota archaeon]